MRSKIDNTLVKNSKEKTAMGIWIKKYIKHPLQYVWYFFCYFIMMIGKKLYLAGNWMSGKKIDQYGWKQQW